MSEQPLRYFKGEATHGRLRLGDNYRYTRDQVDRHGIPKIRDVIVHSREELESALWETVAIPWPVMRLWIAETLEDEATSKRRSPPTLLRRGCGPFRFFRVSWDGACPSSASVLGFIRAAPC